MKQLRSLIVCLIAACAYNNTSAQCTGYTCPANASALLANTGTINAGSTYCVSTTTDLSSSNYSINGTLIVQAGTLSIGNVTINQTGVIVVKFGATLNINGILTAPNAGNISTIDNIVVCNGSLLKITGSFSQGMINIAVNDFGAMYVTGAWTASQPTTFKIGSGAVVEVCGSLNANKNGFFTETGTGASYVITRGGTANSSLNGYLSNLQESSKIKWTSIAQSAWVNHPAANSCNPCQNFNLTPGGTNATCGSAATAQHNTVLVTPGNSPVTRPGNTTKGDAIAVYPNPAKQFIYLNLPKEHQYTHMAIYNQLGQQVHRTVIKKATTPTEYQLPAVLSRGLYFVQLTGKAASTTLRLAKD